MVTCLITLSICAFDLVHGPTSLLTLIFFLSRINEVVYYSSYIYFLFLLIAYVPVTCDHTLPPSPDHRLECQRRFVQMLVPFVIFQFIILLNLSVTPDSVTVIILLSVSGADICHCDCIQYASKIFWRTVCWCSYFAL